MKNYFAPFIPIFLMITIWSFINPNIKDQSKDGLRFNQIQIIGSHNSYKLAIEENLMSMLLASNPDTKGLDYYHLPITEQLELGLRSLELDVLYDPKGGHYTNPKGLDLLHSQGIKTEPYNTSELSLPGFKTFHVPDIDFRSSCLAFKGCLSEIKMWSDKNENHIPLIITINPKNSGVDKPGFTQVISFNEAAWKEFDQEILDIFKADDLITPAMIKGDWNTLNEAITKGGWPLLDELRGKVMFVLDSPKENTLQYLESNNYNRPMFANVERGHDHSAFLIKNDPAKMREEITSLVQEGYMVRTRADANTSEARTGDLSRFEAAVQSGAQLISTDYYLKLLSPNHDFEIIFADNSYERCNPILAAEQTCELR